MRRSVSWISLGFINFVILVNFCFPVCLWHSFFCFFRGDTFAFPDNDVPHNNHFYTFGCSRQMTPFITPGNNGTMSWYRFDNAVPQRVSSNEPLLHLLLFQMLCPLTPFITPGNNVTMSWDPFIFQTNMCQKVFFHFTFTLPGKCYATMTPFNAPGIYVTLFCLVLQNWKAVPSGLEIM